MYLFNKETIYSRGLYAFLALHLVLWTVFPALIRYNLPLDTIEGTIWGHQLQWGYDKNPFLNGWLTALATHLTGPSGWGTYLFSQLAVIASLWAAFQIGKRMLPAAYALLAVLLLEGVQYYNFHAIDFNDNTLELGLWALTMLCFYDALSTQQKKHWLLTGIFAGLAMMAKYYTLALLAGMGLLLLSDRHARTCFKTAGPYLALMSFLVICTPHIVWLCSHDFITVKYVFARGSSLPHWSNRFFFPAQFAWQQFQAFLPALIIGSLLLIGRAPWRDPHAFQLSTFDRRFLGFVGLGPFLLTLLLSLSLSVNLRAGWGMPLMTLWGIILIAIIKPRLSHTKVLAFITGIIVLLIALVTGYTISLTRPTSTTTANYPGADIARIITEAWHVRYQTPLTYVAGSRWVGGNIGFYSPDHPAVFVEWSSARAPWIDVEKLKQTGAVFVWDITGNETLPANIRDTFKTLLEPMTITLNWHRSHTGLKPTKVGLAFLPPSSSLSSSGSSALSSRSDNDR